MITKNHDDIIEFFPKVFCDDRGEFLELYNTSLSSYFKGLGISFIQDNLSVSKKGVIRGMHLQLKSPQGKLVTVIRGSAIDSVIDVRKDSDTFGKVYTFQLNDRIRNLLWIPPGFAHGFQALQENTVFHYKVTSPYDPNDEYSIDPFDKDISIDWDTSAFSNMSKKDMNAISFKQFLEGVL